MLRKIQIFKALDIEIKKQRGPSSVKRPYRDHKSLKEVLSQSRISIIAEISGGNPMHGKVRQSFRPSTHAKSLFENGAKALSVATDPFLYASMDKHLPEVRGVATCPLIRRDFIFEEYQIEESKILGADAIYLFASLLEPERLKSLHEFAANKNLDVVVEVASEFDLENALEIGAQIICVVGRNLDTWEPSWEKTIKLLKKVPQNKCLRMAEAGISSLGQIRELESLGVHGVIICDVLLNEFYPGKRLGQLLAGVEPARKAPKKSVIEDKSEPDESNADKYSKQQSSSSSFSKHPSRGHKETSMSEIIKAENAATAGELTEKKPVAPKKVAPAKKATAKKPAAKKAAKPAAKKATPKKKTTAKPAAKKAAPKKAAPKKVAAKKVAPKKAAPKKVVAKKVAAKKAAPKKAAPKKVVAKKVAAKKVAPKKVAPKKVAPKKVAPKKVAAKKAAPKKAAPKKVAAKKVAPKKAAPKKVAAKKVAPKKVAPKKVVAKKVAPKKAAPKKVVAKKVAPKKAVKSVVKKALTTKKSTPAKKGCCRKR